MTAQQIQEQIGGTLEHTGGNCYSIVLGNVVIGIFHEDGTPAGEIEAFNVSADEWVTLAELGVQVTE